MVTVTDDKATPGASPVDPPAAEKAPTRGRLVVRRFLRRKGAVFGLVVVVLLYLMAFLGPLISPGATPNRTTPRSSSRRAPSTGSAPPRSARTCSRR
ncbi:hypothetical protein ACFQV2_05890 [Actinokineospora soli]|uniref:Oligopeptide transport permease C-like N-terminal domain-containing protein n=1 Tax=Actinokineospora soli TaxID=1048753 RepID=A0ABW2TJ22_9PSEU